MFVENVWVFRLCLSWRPSCPFIAVCWLTELLRSRIVISLQASWRRELGQPSVRRASTPSLACRSQQGYCPIIVLSWTVHNHRETPRRGACFAENVVFKKRPKMGWIADSKAMTWLWLNILTEELQEASEVTNSKIYINFLSCFPII